MVDDDQVKPSTLLSMATVLLYRALQSLADLEIWRFGDSGEESMSLAWGECRLILGSLHFERVCSKYCFQVVVNSSKCLGTNQYVRKQYPPWPIGLTFLKEPEEVFKVVGQRAFYGLWLDDVMIFFFYRAAFVKRLAERGMTVSLSLPCWFGDAKYSTQSSFSSVKVSGTCAKFEGEE